MKKEFKEFAKQFDYGLALVVFEHCLEPGFFEGLTFKEWDQIRSASSAGTKLHDRAGKKMTELANTFEDWIEMGWINPDLAAERLLVLSTDLEKTVKAYKMIKHKPLKKEAYIDMFLEKIRHFAGVKTLSAAA